MPEYTELELYKIEQAKRLLLDAYTMISDVKPILNDIDGKHEPLNRVLDSLAAYSLFFKRIYSK